MILSADSAPALGDIRQAGRGVTIWLREGVNSRKDWPRYADALMVALTRGADIRWVHEARP
ncbi:hypothetical protein HOS59_gp37 [Streptomyces phage Rowa]|uniref:Uncharacterized protein n=1 Tax=Streptomyces phage Rowa TaxID=2059883 RepID=A0A2H5BLZ1_9CAUD|nr:hypothetical protein HOS59_gp37 [Streptomyces phage Rowa]AUG87301.1 hypothetical protein SEA_ROWA_37 [Streptomyces phage Rowa]